MINIQSFYPSKVPEEENVESSRTETVRTSGCAEQHQSVSEQLKPLLEPDPVWKEFPRQQMAFEFSRSCQQSVAVFAFESKQLSRPGQRRYLVTTYYEFGKKYISMKPPKHFYEVIPEYSACHLYFDIEYKISCNEACDSLKLLDCFIQHVCCQLRYCYTITCGRSNILDLESSTPEKFSRHLIFRLQGAVFKNNISAGKFVKAVCDQLRSLRSHPPTVGSRPDAVMLLHGEMPCGGVKLRSYKCSCPPVEDLLELFVLNEKGERVLICDEAVYTRNRNFRLFLSTKLGKSAKLVVANQNKFRSSYSEDPKHPRQSRLKNNLMESLVCNVSFESSQRILDFSGTSDRRPSQDETFRQSRKRPHDCADSAVPASLTTSSGAAAAGTEGSGTSPYPSVDQFITSQLSRGGVQGSIRRWTFFPVGKLIVYDIQDYRWCENIGRHHKSNNIMIVVDLVRGIYYQKCHDPDCRRFNFRSADYPIPPHLNPFTMAAQLQQQQKQWLDLPVLTCPLMTSSPIKSSQTTCQGYVDLNLSVEEAESNFRSDVKSGVEEKNLEPSNKQLENFNKFSDQKEEKAEQRGREAGEEEEELNLSKAEIASFFSEDEDGGEDHAAGGQEGEEEGDVLNLTKEEVASFFSEDEGEEEAAPADGEEGEELNLSQEEIASFFSNSDDEL